MHHEEHSSRDCCDDGNGEHEQNNPVEKADAWIACGHQLALIALALTGPSPPVQQTEYDRDRTEHDEVAGQINDHPVTRPASGTVQERACSADRDYRRADDRERHEE